jgi:aryl-alcohol dehydrogenase-like predicted oxidoreductase
MEQRSLGGLFEVSALTLGGGGIGQIWGETTKDEAVATTRAAYDAGVTLFDVAPAYGDGKSEIVLGEAFASGYPSDARVLTKCMLGDAPINEVAQRLEASLDESFGRIRRDYADVFLLHGQIIPDDREDATTIQVRMSTYLDAARYALADLVTAGRVGAWGISALGPAPQGCLAINSDPAPQVVECTVNALYSGLPFAPDDERPQQVMAAATARGAAVIGVRINQRGALTDALDREEPDDARVMQDYVRAAGFREIAHSLGWTASYLSHRYSLSIPNVSTVVLGVKNRSELAECVKACEDGPLDPELVRETAASMAPN